VTVRAASVRRSRAPRWPWVALVAVAAAGFYGYRTLMAHRVDADALVAKYSLVTGGRAIHAYDRCTARRLETFFRGDDEPAGITAASAPRFYRLVCERASFESLLLVNGTVVDRRRLEQIQADTLAEFA
jgi:hypothetical protein